MSTRLNINVNDSTAAALREMAARNETSVTEIIRRAVGTYKYIEEGARAGKAVQLHGSGEVITLVIL